MSIILRQNIILLNLFFPLFCRALNLYAIFSKKHKTVNAAAAEKYLTNLSESHYLKKYWNYSQFLLTKLFFEKKVLQQPKFYGYSKISKKTINKLSALLIQTKKHFLFFRITKTAALLKSQPIKLVMKSYFSVHSLLDVIDADLKKIFICEEIVNRETVPTFHELSQRDAWSQFSDNLQFLIKKIINQKHFFLCLRLHNYCKSVPAATPLVTFALLTIFSKYRRLAQSHTVFVKNKTETNLASLIPNIRLLSFYNCFLFNALYV